MKQPPYPAAAHDSIQYHFFCDDKLFAALGRAEQIDLGIFAMEAGENIAAVADVAEDEGEVIDPPARG